MRTRSKTVLISRAGYSSSLRYYPDYGIAIAFQINTDIGIVDDKTPVLREMEAGLAEVVISATRGLNEPTGNWTYHCYQD